MTVTEHIHNIFDPWNGTARLDTIVISILQLRKMKLTQVK